MPITREFVDAIPLTPQAARLLQRIDEGVARAVPRHAPPEASAALVGDAAPLETPALVPNGAADKVAHTAPTVVVKPLARGPGWTLPALADLFARLPSEPTITNQQHPGVTPNRLRTLLPEHLRDEVLTLVHWLDAAGLLEPPINANEPYRHPRQVRVVAPADILTRLEALPPEAS